MELYIFNEIHLLPENGAVYEVICSRVRYMQNEIENSQIRIIALSTSLAWNLVPPPPEHVQLPSPSLEIHILGYDHNNKATRGASNGETHSQCPKETSES